MTKPQIDYSPTPISPSSLAGMANHGSEAQKKMVASHPNTPRQTLQRLASEKIYGELIAANPSADGRTLIALHEADRALAPLIASNPSCPASLLIELADHEADIVRASVASNKNSPAELVQNLALDDVDVVRTHAIRNKSCPEVGKIFASLLGTPR
jgi:hypothetical protein